MQFISRRDLASTVWAAAMAAGLLVAGISAADAAEKVKIGVLAFTSHSPSFIATEKGYFADQGLEPELIKFQAAQPMAIAIASGDVDFGVTAISGGLISLAEKGVIKIIGGALQETPGIVGQKIIVSKAAYDAGVTSPAMLKDRTFGITTAGSSFHYMAHKIADKEGFPRSAIHLKPLQKVPAIIAALKSGQIDAWSIVPNIAGALTRGPNVVEIGNISDYVDNYQVTTVFTSTAIATDKRDLAKRFLAGFSKGIDDYNAALVDKTMNEADTAKIVAMIHKYVYADKPLEKADPRIRAGAMRINANAKMNLKSIEDQLNWFKSEKLVPADVSMADLVDTSFVETYYTKSR